MNRSDVVEHLKRCKEIADGPALETSKPEISGLSDIVFGIVSALLVLAIVAVSAMAYSSW